VEGLRSGLRELGYIEGNNVVIELRFAENPAHLPELATELSRREVAVVIGSGNAATRAAQSASSRIPILFAAADDPVRLGFVASFNRPGGNITGLSLISGALGPKRFELLREIVPQARNIAVLTNPNNPAQHSVRGEQEAARSMGLSLIALEASTDHEIQQAFTIMAERHADALLVNADAFFTARRELLAVLSARYSLPAIYAWREFPEAGGLMSYGTSLFYGYQQIGAYAGRILRGEKPAELPVIQPTKFELVINLKTANALGLTIPPTLLARADEVIE